MTKSWLVILLGLSAISSVFAMAQRRPEDRFLYLDTKDTLQIEFLYSAPPAISTSSPSIADEMERQAEQRFRQAMEIVLQSFQLPMEYRVLKLNECPEEGHPILRISALRWEQDRFGELEAGVRGALISYGERNELGSARTREPAFGAPSVDRMERIYVTAMVKSLSKIMHEFMMHFESAEGIEMGEVQPEA